MPALPTTRATLAFAACTAMHLLGLSLQALLPCLLGTAGLLGLSLCLSLTIPVARNLRALRMEFGWSADAGGPGGARARIGQPLTVRCYFHNHGPLPVTFYGLRPSTSSGLVASALPAAIHAAPHSRTEFSLQVHGRAAGRWLLHGLSAAVPGPVGLFLSPVYFPTPLVARVLPRAYSSQVVAGARVTPQEAGPLAARSPPAAGGGELRELRELLPGDPYRAIAWKASARRGRLLVREQEQEAQNTVLLVLDVSGPLRHGTMGDRALDGAIDLASAVAEHALVQGDLAGLITVDGRVIDRVAPRGGLRHMQLIYEALLTANTIVDADLTEAGPEDVELAVARYLRRQDGLSAQHPGTPRTEELVQQVRGAFRDDAHAGPVVGENENDELLRRFCRLRGIPLPYREYSRGFGKGRGLNRALQLAAGEGRSARCIVLIADSNGVQTLDELERATRMIRARGHHLAVAHPSGFPNAAPVAAMPGRWVPGDQVALAELERLKAQRRILAARRFFAQRGVPLYTFSPGSPPLRLAQTLLHTPQRAGPRSRSA